MKCKCFANLFSDSPGPFPHWEHDEKAGWGFEQPGVEGGVPAYSRAFELDDLKDPFQTIP